MLASGHRCTRMCASTRAHTKQDANFTLRNYTRFLNPEKPGGQAGVGDDHESWASVSRDSPYLVSTRQLQGESGRLFLHFIPHVEHASTYCPQRPVFLLAPRNPLKQREAPDSRGKNRSYPLGSSSYNHRLVVLPESPHNSGPSLSC